MTSTLNRIVSAVTRTNRALEVTDRLTEQVNPGENFTRGAPAINNASRQVEEFNRRQNEAGNGANKIKSVWGGLGGIIKTALAAFSIKKIIDLSDNLTLTTARLDLINDGLQTTSQLQDKIMASANRARASYTDTAAVVSKLGTLAGSAFKSNDEMIAFTELINKNFVIGGASIEEQKAAMYQLAQAMASGKLQGDEFRSIMENAPMLAQAIAKYTGKSMADLRQMSAEGKITADIIKGAMFSTADEVNKKFAQLPMTFGQVATVIGNTLLQTFQPVIQLIGQGAQWIYDNWSTIEPIFWGLVAAVGAFALITGIWTAVTWLQVAANRALLASMLTNPILWIAIAIGIVIGLIYKWVQSVGGLRVAWLIVCNALLTAWDWVKIGFFTGVYWVMDMWNQLQLAFMTAGVNIANFMGDMKANVLMILQNMINGAIDIINGFISVLNKIPGVSIDLIDKVTFGTTAQMENEAAKQARNQGLEAYRSQIENQIKDRDAKLNQMKADAQAATAQRQAEIATAKAEAAQKKAQENADLTSKFATNGDIANVGKVGEVGKIKDDVNIADEDLKLMRDVAEMRVVQNFVTLTPTVAMNAQISEKVDVDEVVRKIETKLEDEFAMAAEGVYS
ncbi:tape measure protein [Gudongella oleilytica]|uniref:tape measure protein n=1 Tax=Gudongella oleilytica TaxID=1582259 RepID=UPI002A35B030|nr:tape measure protein [Gudongella oleilytica]MDY0256255.1 tape measure protein [Gudongella oleilytica]